MTKNDDWERSELAKRAEEADRVIAERRKAIEAKMDPEANSAFDKLRALDEAVRDQVAELAGPPKPLGTRRELPAWPVHVLPAWVAEHVTATAERLQVPVDLCAQLALGTLSSVFMGKAEVRAGTWAETLNLYLYCAMHSGAGKSPAEKAIVGPLREWENERRVDGEDELATSRAMWRAARKKAQKMEESFAMGSVSREQLAEAVLQANIEEPVAYRLTVDDVTPERLVQLLAKHRRLALISTEAGLLDTVAGQYSQTKQANIDVYLKAWSGEDIQRDRKGGEGGAESTVVRGALMSVVLTIQPSVIEKYQLTSPELRGRGFFARFMPSVPKSLVGSRTYGVMTEPGPERDVYVDKLKGLASAAQGYLAMTLHLDEHARALFFSWCETMEGQLGPGGRLSSLHDAASKIRSSVMRTAGLLHLAESLSGASIGPGVMARAIEVGDYWVEHALNVEGAVDPLGSDEAHAAKTAHEIIEWGRKHRARTFTPRDLHTSMRRRYRYLDDMLPGLEHLVQRGWVFMEEGDLSQVGVRGARVLCAFHPQAFTLSGGLTTESGSSRTSTRTSMGVSFPPPPPIPPITPHTQRERVHVRVLVADETNADEKPEPSDVPLITPELDALLTDDWRL